jgi:hypothetical protein
VTARDIDRGNQVRFLEALTCRLRKINSRKSDSEIHPKAAGWFDIDWQ